MTDIYQFIALVRTPEMKSADVILRSFNKNTTRNWVLWTVCDLLKIDLLFPLLNRFVLSANQSKLRKKKTSIKLIDMVDRYHLSSIILSKRTRKLRFYVKIQGLISQFCFTSCRLRKDMAMKTSYFKIANIDWLPN